MKVLLVHELFPPTVAGGGEIIAGNTALQLRKRGVGVSVLTTGFGPARWKGVSVSRIPVNRFLMNLCVLPVLKRAAEADLIHCFTYNSTIPSLLASRLRGKPCVCTVLGIYGKEWKEIRGPVLGRLCEIAERIQVFRNFDATAFLSEFSMYQALETGRVRNPAVTRPGTDPEKFRPGKKEPFVLFVGRLSKQKGIRYLVEAARLVPDVEFLLVGSGPERPPAPENVKFLGAIPHSPRLYDLYGRALIFCLPSIGEGLGLVVQEAMASGCAVVSTVPLDFEGVRIPPKNPEKIAEAVRYLADNPGEAKRMGRKNRKIAERYTWDRYGESVLDVYRRVVE